MRTRRQRRWYSAFGLALWLTCCVFAFAHNHLWSLLFFIATVIWMLTLLGYMARDHWENRQ